MTAAMLVLLGASALLGAVFFRPMITALMLLVATQFLGLLAESTYTVPGQIDVHAILLALMLIAVAIRPASLVELRRSPVFWPSMGFAAFGVYAVLLPVLSQDSTVFFALKASKEYWVILALPAVLACHRSGRHVEGGWVLIAVIGVFYSIVEIVAQLAGPSLREIFQYDIRPEAEAFWKVYVPFWPFIELTLLVAVFETGLGAGKRHFVVLICGLGLLLTFFRSYALATLATVPTALLLGRVGFSRLAYGTFGIAGLLAAALLVAGLMVASGPSRTDSIFNQFFYSGIEEVVQGRGGALEGRAKFGAERLKVLEARPLFGYGFLDKESRMGTELRSHFTGPTLGFIDKGDVDVAVKFGYIGRVAFYGIVLGLVAVLLRRARRERDQRFKARTLAVASLFGIYLIVQPVHAPLTYSFGLFPAFLALGLLERGRLMRMRPRGRVHG